MKAFEESLPECAVEPLGSYKFRVSRLGYRCVAHLHSGAGCLENLLFIHLNGKNRGTRLAEVGTHITDNCSGVADGDKPMLQTKELTLRFVEPLFRLEFRRK